MRRFLEIADRHPDLSMVIDHAMKPGIAHREYEPWATHMAELAARPNTVCKLSGLLTEAGEGAGAEDLEPYVVQLLELFGPDRLMFGSDWPVLLNASTYPEWIAMAEGFSAQLSPTERAAIFGGTAARIYGLHR